MIRHECSTPDPPLVALTRLSLHLKHGDPRLKTVAEVYAEGLGLDVRWPFIAGSTRTHDLRPSVWLSCALLFERPRGHAASFVQECC